MRRIDPSKKEIIAEYIDKHFCEHDEIPSVRDIVEGTGIPLSTVHRYLISMREDGSLDYSGRRTARTKLMEDAAPIHALQVLGTVACGPGQEEEQRFIEYIRMPESLVEKGDFFALIAKGESMIGAGIFPGDYVFVKRQQTANEGDLVIALFDGKNGNRPVLPAIRNPAVRFLPGYDSNLQSDFHPVSKRLLLLLIILPVRSFYKHYLYPLP